MRKWPAIIGAAALGTAGVTGFVLTQTGGTPTVSLGAAAAGDFNAVGPGDVFVTCAPGAATGTADVSVQVAPRAGARFRPGDSLGPARQVVVTWDGGDGSATITRFGRAAIAGAGSTFPCPASQDETATTGFHFQLMAGVVPVGGPVTVSATLHRLGSAS